MINRAYDPKEDKKSLSRLARLYKKTKLDPSFQRLGGVENGSGWTLAHSNEYLADLFDGFVSNTIILLCVADCLKYAKEEKDQESVKYFSDVRSEGYDYVSVDGNNSTSTIAGFVNGYPKLKINGKRLEDFDDEEMEEWLHDERLNVAILRRISISEACDQFRKVNKQTKLNDQEHRQARWSNLSRFVRETANDTRDSEIEMEI
jgi:hypothetical protein